MPCRCAWHMSHVLKIASHAPSSRCDGNVLWSIYRMLYFCSVRVSRQQHDIRTGRFMSMQLERNLNHWNAAFVVFCEGESTFGEQRHCNENIPKQRNVCISIFDIQIFEVVSYGELLLLINYNSGNISLICTIFENFYKKKKQPTDFFYLIYIYIERHFYISYLLILWHANL